MPAIVSFTSDFGLADPYVGTVKAVMLAACPGLTIVDVTHDVAPQAVVQAAFLTQQSWPFFPDGTVHLVVVDPGVGTARAAVALRTPRGFVVGPDNGVLSAALPDGVRDPGGDEKIATAMALPVPPGYEVRSIESSQVLAQRVSATFHGRDIFGPAAARLAAGFPFEQIGPSRDSLLALPSFHAISCEGHVRGEVVHVDRFGNLISSIRAADLPSGATDVQVCERFVPIVHTYGDASGLIALVGSSGYLELAVTNGSAARELRAGLGLEVRVPVPAR